MTDERDGLVERVARAINTAMTVRGTYPSWNNGLAAAQAALTAIRAEDGGDLLKAAEAWVDRALAVHAGERPCDVSDYRDAFLYALASQAAEIAALREALEPVAAAKDNEATSHPFWLVIDPRQLLTPSIGYVGPMIKGVFFSREAADRHIEQKCHRYSNRVGVFCCSGNDSPEFRALYDASRAALAHTPEEGGK